MPKKAIQDLVGQTFNRLTVVELAPYRTKANRVLWICQCSCGETIAAQANNLRSGNTQSCGCLIREISAARFAVIGRLPNRQKPDDEIAYTAAHDRVRRVKGSASSHKCVDCGDPAQDWSLSPDCPRRRRAGNGKNGNLYISPNPDDYDPRCKKCHARLDGFGGARIHAVLRARRQQSA